jgi:hypothetical protein
VVGKVLGEVTNKSRMAQIEVLVEVNGHAQRFHLGERVGCIVESKSVEGVIDVAYVDLQAAMDAFAVPGNWYEIQNKKPITGPQGRWYGVLLERGAILAGELDLVKLPERVEL